MKNYAWILKIDKISNFSLVCSYFDPGMRLKIKDIIVKKTPLILENYTIIQILKGDVELTGYLFQDDLEMI